MARETLPPGVPAPASGQYEIVGPDGAGTGEERTVVKDEPMPPTPRSGQEYRIADRTANNAGRPGR